MRRLLPCAGCCSVLLAACYPFASAAILCCPFALPGLLRWQPGWLLPDGVLQQRPCQQQLCHGAPASNKPHLAKKSTPVWLAIWCTWAGFANSQLLPDAAALSSMQGIPRSSNIFRTDFRFAPSLPHRFACGPIPFTRTWASTVCAEEFPTPREMSLHGLHLLRQTQICRPICTDCLRHLRISAR